MAQNWVIRPAQLEDAAALCRLNREAMGYDYPPDATRQNLQHLLGDGSCRIFVAQQEGQVIGYVHARDYNTLYFEPMKDILGLAVHPQYRRCGVGRALLEAVEEWGLHTGAKGIRLVSGKERTQAHTFYLHCSFMRCKEQVNMKKPLTGNQ